jgi:hypothetical protein
MRDQVGKCVDRDRQRAGADRHVRVADAHDIEQQRHRKDRATATDDAEDQPDGTSR